MTTSRTEQFPSTSVVPLSTATASVTDKIEASLDSLGLHSNELSAAESFKSRAKIMIVDDEKIVTSVVRRFLQADGYKNFVIITDPREAMEAILKEMPDVVLLDINMPEVDGMEILQHRRNYSELNFTPFIVLSACQDSVVRQQALEYGATDFLAKPVEQVELKLRVQNTLIVKQHFNHLSCYAKDLENKVKERTILLERSREQILQCLARAAEYRDNETGRHVIRVGKYARVIAEKMGLPATFCTQIEMAAPLHDLGKIGIPDAILLSPNKLTAEEFDVMKTHCDIGRGILDPFAAEEVQLLRDPKINRNELPDSMRLPLLTMAARIAQTHHEKWDGTGYPLGLKGEMIPIEGRITAVADVYDALCSHRPYKQGFGIEKSLEIMLADRGTRFDPDVLDAFCEKIARIERIRKLLSDECIG